MSQVKQRSNLTAKQRFEIIKQRFEIMQMMNSEAALVGRFTADEYIDRLSKTLGIDGVSEYSLRGMAKSLGFRFKRRVRDDVVVNKGASYDRDIALAKEVSKLYDMLGVDVPESLKMIQARRRSDEILKASG